MDEASHAQRLDELIGRFGVAVKRAADAADDVRENVRITRRLENVPPETAVGVSARTKRVRRHLNRLAAFADLVTAGMVKRREQAAELHDQRPASTWGRWRQYRRLRSLTRRYESVADRLERFDRTWADRFWPEP